MNPNAVDPSLPLTFPDAACTSHGPHFGIRGFCIDSSTKFLDGNQSHDELGRFDKDTVRSSFSVDGYLALPLSPMFSLIIGGT